MTRETKIGLLVGLAFIIVIGILLSDHIGSTTEPMQAAITDVAPNVRQSVSAPNTADRGTMTVVSPQPVVPQNPVPVQRDPQAGSNPVSIVDIKPGDDPSKTPMPTSSQDGTGDAGNGIRVLPPVGNELADSNPRNNGDNASLPGGLKDLVNSHSGDLAPVGINHPDQPKPLAPQPGVQAGYRQIKAEESDTVTRLASKYLGGNTKANRDAIIKANPSMTPDGHLVIAGHTYLIPAVAGAPAPAPASNTPAPAPRVANAAAPAAPAPPPAGGSWYTVKDNDRLWTIAAEQLGAGSRWMEIRDLNKDILKGSDQLRANMRLRIPAKSVASTN